MTTLWERAAAVPDPELPGLTIGDLGILRDVRDEGGTVVVAITPTYSGCPALREIMLDLDRRFERAEIRVVLDPPWTTDWITPEGHRKLREAGIAPPQPTPTKVFVSIGPRRGATCTNCGSADTVEQSRFGATACRALHRCRACGEPFEHLKAV